MDVNILAGTVEWITRRPLGYLVASIDGDEARTAEAIRLFEENGVEVEVLTDAEAAQ